ncbi:hypothetical protein Bb109J_c1061 [Bdellovibrio bacteriovorus]|uniref:hypothetical protein n=1 Tax=Bdellovibrio bacteriovorus TaxID=959 RepID=UPI00045C0321|nr:hypothetical protein [Bdellovibrio bacteriovorus]AHZ86400.1 hypothetical protein EP01_15875 [Bdellovibrio bacteriovorus]BEV67641.1 hypothetical protein Bb109J_c1061 [Bdellovibrio bacteriovorus]
MMEVSLRFAMSGLLCLLLIATGGCSFKKDPAKGHAPVTLIEEQALPEHVASLDEVIAGDDEEKAIEALVQRKDELAALSRGGAVSALDLAIKHGKQKVAQFLLISGQSPFVLNQESREKLTYDAAMGKLIESAQLDGMMDILRSYPKKTYEGIAPDTSMQKFRDRINLYQLGYSGCEKFANMLMEREYLSRDPSMPGLYYQVMDTLKPREVFDALLKDTSCSIETVRFSTELINKWVGYEFLYQFQSSFKSIDFIKSLVSMRKGAALSLVVPAGDWHRDNQGLLSSQVKVSPLAMLMLKKDCFGDEGQRDEWVDLIRELTSQAGQDYSYPYYMPDDMPDGMGSCMGENKYCAKSPRNVENLYKIFRYTNSKSQILQTDFYSLYTGERRQFVKMTFDQFKAEICTEQERRTY